METGLDVLQPVVSVATPSLIADQLRELIVNGTFPPGMQVRENPIADQRGVSRGPVREALARLIQEGLLVARRNRGVFVVSLGPEDVTDIYRARRPLEEAAALELRRSGDAAVLARLEELVDQMAAAERRGDWPAVVDSDIAFHRTIVDAAGSPRLSRMFRTLLVESRICIGALKPAYSETRSLSTEHQDLIGVLRTGTPRAITKAVRDHLERAVRDLTVRG